MATITIETTPEEQDIVIQALRALQGQCIPVSEIARKSGLSPNRVRYVLVDLLEAGRITREATKAYNKHYVRYQYYIAE